jgi:hypothetical protein
MSINPIRVMWDNNFHMQNKNAAAEHGTYTNICSNIITYHTVPSLALCIRMSSPPSWCKWNTEYNFLVFCSKANVLQLFQLRVFSFQTQKLSCVKKKVESVFAFDICSLLVNYLLF